MDYGDASRPSELVSARNVAISGAVLLLVSLIQVPKDGSTRLVAAVRIVVFALARVWVHVASHFVPEPYLDEVFHVPQAQKYCEGRFNEWDDKITTPPGLYLLSQPLHHLVDRIRSLGRMSGVFGCDTASLRATNALALTALAYLATLARQRIESRLYEAHAGKAAIPKSQYAAHTALNVALCPIIFFFSGLYYTDVASTAAVLACFVHSLGRLGRERSSIGSDLATVGIGLLALLMRQTNVFWVVVFLGCLEGIHAVKTLRPERVDQPVMNTLSEQVRFFAWRYSLGDIHDPPLNMAWPDDWLWSVVSILVAAVCNLPRVLRQVWPHITVLISFVAFVVWNGGVVLGDKSNHVATIHLAQMLYIWPLFAFFSLPLLIPYALPLLGGLARLLPGQQPNAQISERKGRQAKSETAGITKKASHSLPKQSNPSSALRLTASILSHTNLSASYITATVVVSVLIVKFNTIIHPFTLADNRHYMFYVFRYSIRRSQAIRFALVLPYTLSRWLVWGTLSGCPEPVSEDGASDCSLRYNRLSSSPYTSHPLRIVKKPDDVRQTDSPYPPALESTSTRFEEKKMNPMEEDPLACSTEPVSTSTAVVFLFTTTLSLVTAPLVEPRYFIIPWVIWRLLTPAWRLHDHAGFVSRLRQPDTKGYLDVPLEFFQRYDLRLILETIWFVVINLVTMYIFITRPYQWRAEDGMLLDEGRWQRFMW